MDLSCETTEVNITAAKIPIHAHAGILLTASRIRDEVLPVLCKIFDSGIDRSYKVICVGHSLGAV